MQAYKRLSERLFKQTSRVRCVGKCAGTLKNVLSLNPFRPHVRTESDNLAASSLPSPSPTHGDQVLYVSSVYLKVDVDFFLRT